MLWQAMLAYLHASRDASKTKTNRMFFCCSLCPLRRFALLLLPLAPRISPLPPRRRVFVRRSGGRASVSATASTRIRWLDCASERAREGDRESRPIDDPNCALKCARFYVQTCCGRNWRRCVRSGERASEQSVCTHGTAIRMNSL